MLSAFERMLVYLMMLLTFVVPFVTGHPVSVNLTSSLHGSSQLVSRSMGELDCNRLRPVETSPNICYLGYQAARIDQPDLRLPPLVVDLSVWNQSCNRIGYATFAPPGKTYNLYSELPYVVVAELPKVKSWFIPASLDYAGKHFDGGRDGKVSMRYSCYYPYENDLDYPPAFPKLLIFCFVPFKC
ncbi:hypothetical protein WAI453_007989 [Rhynchosporium graminicola]|uniref:Uncharacterized protein n=1 Tax=Rhynchosporium graminicola TaxID=2792576 RepID=A0A1E1LK86_9HELO|nr:uncharacterized protein RCO7_03539 [Rhynchosporium commune]